MTLKCFPPPLPLGHRAPHRGWRSGRHLLRLIFFHAEDTKWKRRFDPDLEECCLSARSVHLEPAEHTCLHSQWTLIINAAQNLATGRWTIIIMPKKSLSPSKKKRKGTVATFCQLPWVDPHQLPPIQDRQCQISPASTQYIPSKVHVCKVPLGAKKLPGTWSEPPVLPC